MEIKREEIIEGNEFIAVFMGINKGIDILGYHFWLCNLKFHSSWDSLMSVVEKIESLDWVVEIVRNSCSIKCGSKPNKFFETYKVCDTKIEAVWLACVGFSDWYNRNYK